MRFVSRLARMGPVGVRLVLLRETMRHPMWEGPLWGGSENPPTTFDLADALFNEWAVATLVLGALLSMAMIGSSYLVRDERLVNLVWDMGGDDQ
jgi:NADH:ubiquinone oxidoreductase subunit 6 (subunit J)